MKTYNLFLILPLLLLLVGQLALAQDEEGGDDEAVVFDGAADGLEDLEDGAEDADAAEPKADADEDEECEEAWSYMEFLKNNVKDEIEIILQETMFQSQALLEVTVADTMSQVLAIRDAVLDRVKAIRTGDDSIQICPEQGIKQEEFLASLRMDIMTVLLRLIEQDAATPEALQDIGKQLLAIRTTVNGKISEIIMLRENLVVGTTGGDEEDCDAGILPEVLASLDAVIATATDEKAAGGEEDEPVAMLTMVLMTVDGRIGSLYNEILGQLDEAKRGKANNELLQLKDISRSVNEVLIKLIDEDSEAKVKRILTRDVVRVRNEVDRQLQQVRKTCIHACDACGAEKIDEVLDKLQDYNISLITREEEDAKETIRSDLISYLTQLNTEMTNLLTTKIESEEGELEKCDAETLEVINSAKAPLWMLVNITIFGDGAIINEMVVALNAALLEMRTKYCDSSSTVSIAVGDDDDDNKCYLEEIDTAGEWIIEIDKVIATNLFKTGDDQGQARTDAMLGFLEIKSNMEERVRQLFQENLVCKEEVDQIKQFYSEHITRCLAEMMNPKYRFETKTRAEKVQCIKGLRVAIEQRRGELLLKEVERRINAKSAITFNASVASSDVAVEASVEV